MLRKESKSIDNIFLSCAFQPSLMLAFVTSCLTLTCLIQPLSCQELTGCDHVTKLYAEDLDLRLFQDSVSLPGYYRYLTIDLESNHLFVGAMNRIFGLYLNNIEHESKKWKKDFEPKKDSQTKCITDGKVEKFDCQNHVRLLIRNHTVPNTFYMCSTGAYKPQAYELQLVNNRFVTLKYDMSGVGICPYDPADNATAIFVEKGTPGDIPSLFAGTYTNVVKSDPSFSRPPLYQRDGSVFADFVRTVRYKNDWFNEPQFVGSFDVGQYVYVFFREVALEYTNCGKKIYSRVARVCKNDLGGNKNLIENIWLSFVKARLNCSIPGEYPYYFDEIQDVFRVGNTFYALFTTNINGLTASAICVYNVHRIDKAFQGAFKAQADKEAQWLPMHESDVPHPRPGNCSAPASLRRDESQPHKRTDFILGSSMLMDRSVSHAYGKPIFYKSNTLMQKLVGAHDVAQLKNFVFFTATNTGVIYKIAAWPGLTTMDPPKTYLVSTYIPFSDSQPIWSLKMFENWLYFGTDMSVGQISVETCKKYKKIDLCIYDPYCGWDKILKECHSSSTRQNLIHFDKIDLLSYSLEEAITKQVERLYSFERISKISGRSVTLAVEYLLHISGTVQWTKNGTRVSGKRHILAKDNSLIVTDLRKSDEGIYKAVDEFGRPVAEYALVVDISKEQIEQRWMRKFDQWCDEFERYQEDIRQWERKCESCCQETALTNVVPAIGGGQ